jgi:3-oxoacyl-[acyl-carrier-protein] synthase-1
MVFASYNNIISGLGFSTDENYRAILNSELAVKKTILPFSIETFCVAKIDETLLKNRFSSIEKTERYTMLEQLSILSIQDVMTQSGINPADEKTLLIYSTTKGNIDLLEKNNTSTIDKNRMYLWSFANVLKQHFNFKHTPIVLSNACISGLLAIIIAKRYIESGTYNNVIVCGGDILSEFTLSGFKSFNALSNEPSKPFDTNRVGINLGEAVSTILITNNKALAKPYETQIVSGFSANDANHISGPSRTGDGLFQCLNQLNVTNKTDIGFISAHGTATQFNDEMESIAIERAELSDVPVNSLKGYYGHTLGAAGVLETILSLESLKNQTLIKSEGFESLGVSGKISVIDSFEIKSFQSFIKTASGFGGCNAAALFRNI